MSDTERVKDFIRRSFGDIRSSRDVAREFNISVETLRKDFVRIEQKRLSLFISETRIDFMKSLLKETTQHCNSICLAAGFSREEVGERSFKKMTGMTMKQYRELICHERSDVGPKVAGGQHSTNVVHGDDDIDQSG